MCPAIGATSRASRWCPSAEQVMLLEELYKGGLTNPRAGQIHQIVSHLSQFGKVQGKNVFYWFQNHKARDKQNIRKKLVRQHQQLVQCSKKPSPCADNCCGRTELAFHSYDSSLSPFSNDENSVRLPVNSLGSFSKLYTYEGYYGAPGMMQDSGRNVGLAMPIQKSLIFTNRRQSLVTLDLFPVTPRITEVEGSNIISRSYSCATNASRLLPNTYLSLGAPGNSNH